MIPGSGMRNAMLVHQQNLQQSFGCVHPEVGVFSLRFSRQMLYATVSEQAPVDFADALASLNARRQAAIRSVT